MNRGLPALALLALAAAVPSAASAQDRDRDGVPDAVEQALLDRFQPTFVLSAGECDERPARMRVGLPDPEVAARDGTIYGHVTPRPVTPGQPAEIEVQYFHLWSRDCGRPSHALDAEHVSVLLTAPSSDAPAEAWHARYWYAAAHEGTICDASSGAPAATLRATDNGPYVYISRGKHASYLERDHCKWGCGSDECDPGEPLPRGDVRNLGEAGHPLNGSTWVSSGRWSLGEKLVSDFDADRRADLDGADPGRVAVLRLSLRAWQSPILGGDTGLDALLAAGDAAATAAEAAGGAARTAVGQTGRAVGRALGKTGSAVARFLRLRR
ncbi:MAG: hypothetical protein R2712_02820 [Vicinamibacterales bacterium]